MRIRIAVKKNGHCFYSLPLTTISEACEVAKAAPESEEAKS